MNHNDQSKIYSPICITVYDRLEHLESLINSLKKNKEATKSDLYIISDAPIKNEHTTKIKEIREYIKSINGFSKIHIIENEKNLGSFLTYKKLINIVFEDNDSLIFLEDDNIVSQNFLCFINEQLRYWKNNKEIVFVCGYNYPIEIPKDYKYDIYFSQSFSAWGVGIWRDKFINSEDIEKKIILSDKKTLKKLRKKSLQGYAILMSDLLTNKNLNDARMSYYLIKNDKYTIFPCLPLVKNSGHDGSGEHCSKNEFYQNQVLNDNYLPKKYPESLYIDKRVEIEMKNYPNYTFLDKIKINTKIILEKIQYTIF